MSARESQQLLTPIQHLQRALDRGCDGEMLTFVDIDSAGQFVRQGRTYAQLLANGRRVAAALRDAGLQAGDRFALLMPNHPEFVDAMIGSEFASTVFVPIDPRTKGELLAYMLQFIGCRGVIASRSALNGLLEIMDQIPVVEWIWVLDEGPTPAHERVRISTIESALAAVGAAPEWPGADLQRPMQFLFTSGTTGRPKAMLAPYARFATIGTYGPLIQMRPDERLYTGLSLTHANAQMVTLGNALAMALPVVISRKFSKSRLWELLTEFECTFFNLLGGMTVAIFAEPPSRFDRAHKVRTVLSAGMPARMWRAFEERFGVRVCEFYGAAEGGLAINPPGEGPVGSVGKPPPGWICTIRDEDDNEVPDGALGEITFRPEHGSVPSVHYYNNEEASIAKTRGGWFRTGDVGWKDSDGWLYFSHRAGTAIRRNGDFIDARHVETIVAGIDGVDDAYAYGVATDDNAPGERELVLAVVLNLAVIRPDEIFALCRRELGPALAPSAIQLVDEIPKTASEKPIDRQLVALLRSRDFQIIGPNGPLVLKPAGEKR